MSHRRGALNDQFLGDAVGLIFSLALLVLDDAALHVEPSPVDGSLEMAHPVGLDPQGNVQRVAIYGANGTILRKGATFISAGDAIRLNRLVRYQLVQEMPLAWGARNSGIFDLPANYSPAPDVRLAFTDISVPAGTSDTTVLVSDFANAYNTLNTCALSHSQLRGIYQAFRTFATGCTVALTNNLIERSTLTFEQGYTGFYTFAGFSLSAYNNLFHGPPVFKSGSGGSLWTIKDNLFDADSVGVSGTYNVVADYNGYRSGLSSLGGTHNKTITNFDYQTSFLGRFYYPTTGTNLATLIDAGSRTASSAGLSSFTTTTNQVAEGSSTVDIGYHSFAVSTNTTVTIQATAPVATELGQQGLFTVFRTGATTVSLTVYYNVGGTAVPGTDYQPLSGSTIIPTNSASQNIKNITVTPIDNNTITFDKTVVASLILTNSYFVGSPAQATVTVQDSDPLSTNVVVANLNTAVGIDYQTNNNALIVSVNHPTGEPNNFTKLASNFGTAWSTLHGVGHPNTEVKLAVVKVTTNGWNQGDMYFARAQVGGKITADGSNVYTNWATLAGETNFLGGSLYIDQTGVFGGDMIVVTGGSPSSTIDGGAVWRVTSSGSATNLAQIDNPSGTGRILEGVLTVPNDSTKYGPWAGKILTAGERAGLIYALDTSGNVTSYNVEVGWPEDIRLIPSGQNLYCLDEPNNQVLKITSDNFASFGGDILLVDEGLGCSESGVYIVHWTGGGFLVRKIPVGSHLEHVSFAPIDIPALP